MLAKVEWQTVVLDEAQAIKNTATKRSQAAMNLQSSFKLITTGTPIENHLGELWNLFRFINPGLLGSLDSFNINYANPIERSQDKVARDQLKKLIQCWPGYTANGGAPYKRVSSRPISPRKKSNLSALFSRIR